MEAQGQLYIEFKRKRTHCRRAVNLSSFLEENRSMCVLWGVGSCCLSCLVMKVRHVTDKHPHDWEEALGKSKKA